MQSDKCELTVHVDCDGGRRDRDRRGGSFTWKDSVDVGSSHRKDDEAIPQKRRTRNLVGVVNHGISKPPRYLRARAAWRRYIGELC